MAIQVCTRRCRRLHKFSQIFTFRSFGEVGHTHTHRATTTSFLLVVVLSPFLLTPPSSTPISTLHRVTGGGSGDGMGREGNGSRERCVKRNLLRFLVIMNVHEERHSAGDRYPVTTLSSPWFETEQKSCLLRGWHRRYIPGIEQVGCFVALTTRWSASVNVVCHNYSAKIRRSKIIRNARLF